MLQDGRVVGLLMRSDIVRTLGRLGAETQAQPASDEQIVNSSPAASAAPVG
jgi:hypothetical protein